MSKGRKRTCKLAMMAEADRNWPALPTETEIYILPGGEIVVADLPAELAAQIAHLSRQFSSESSLEPTHVADQQHPVKPTHTG